MNLPFDWLILLLRVLFVFLLYFFLFQIVRTMARELGAVSESQRPRGGRAAHECGGAANNALNPAGDDRGRATGWAAFPDPIRGGSQRRREGSAIHLNDTYMSNEHARFFLNDGRWWVANLGSTNSSSSMACASSSPPPVQPGSGVHSGASGCSLWPERGSDGAGRGNGACNRPPCNPFYPRKAWGRALRQAVQARGGDTVKQGGCGERYGGAGASGNEQCETGTRKDDDEDFAEVQPGDCVIPHAAQHGPADGGGWGAAPQAQSDHQQRRRR